jgi:hypothetical protein
MAVLGRRARLRITGLVLVSAALILAPLAVGQGTSRSVRSAGYRPVACSTPWHRSIASFIKRR